MNNLAVTDMLQGRKAETALEMFCNGLCFLTIKISEF